MTWTTRPRSELGALRAIIAGEGPTLLLIHGVGLRAEAWNAQIDALSDRFRVVAVDMPGHGESPCPAGDLALTDYADAIARATPSPALVIGHSMGAMIALDMAVRHAGLVRGVVALNAIFQRDKAARAAVRARADSLDGRTVADPSGALSRWFGDALSPERSACEGWLTSVDPAAYRMAYHVFANEDGPVPASLAALSCPALFLTGGREQNSTPAMSEAMAKLAPRGRAEIVGDAAHMLPMTHAAQINAALLNFAQETLA